MDNLDASPRTASILAAAENNDVVTLETLLDRHPAELESLTTPQALRRHFQDDRICWSL